MKAVLKPIASPRSIHRAFYRAPSRALPSTVAWMASHAVPTTMRPEEPPPLARVDALPSESGRRDINAASMSARAVSFYQRVLPPSCISFMSPEGKKMFARALAAGTLDAFFPLSSQFLSQDEPTYCGLGTLVMVLNALRVDPQQTWKGVWRFYASDMLDCCRPLSTVLEEGLTFAEFTCLARCNGLTVESYVPPTTSPSVSEREAGIARLRADIKRATSAYSPLMAISFSRRALGQTGDGHFSPIGGYDDATDHALIMDVARFKYPSYWAPVPLLWEAMLPVDKATGKPRGYTLLSVPSSRSASADAPTHATLALHKASWAALSRSLSSALLAVRSASTAQDVIGAVAKVITSRPISPVSIRPGDEHAFAEMAANGSAPLRGLGMEPADALFVLSLFSERDGTGPLSSVMDPEMRRQAGRFVAEALKDTGDDLRREVEALRQQMQALGECCSSEGKECGCASGGGKF